MPQVLAAAVIKQHVQDNMEEPRSALKKSSS
jgi:hypothetical protein